MANAQDVRKKVKKFLDGEYKSEETGEYLNPNDPTHQEIFAREILTPYYRKVRESNSESKARQILQRAFGSNNKIVKAFIREALELTIGIKKSGEEWDYYFVDYANPFKVWGETKVKTLMKEINSEQPVSEESRKQHSGKQGTGSTERPAQDERPGTDGGEGGQSSSSGPGGGSKKADSDGSGTSSSAKGRKKTGTDPVLLAIGQYYYQVTDLEVAGRGLSFKFTRTYLSRAAYKGPLGHNWDHAYNLWLREEQEMQADGTLRNIVYRSNGSLREDAYIQRLDQPTGDLKPLGQWQDATFDSPTGFFDRLEKSGGQYILETVNGLRYYYNDQLYVERIEEPNGNSMRFKYDAQNRLRKIVDPVDKEFRFEYDEMNRIVWLIDVVGERRVHYWYGDNGDLEEVDLHLDDFVTGTDYRYAGPDLPYDLQHNLLEVINARGETILENEYGAEPGSRSYDRVVRQRSKSGEFLYEYGLVEEKEVDPDQDPINVATHSTIITYPNGHRIEHQFNTQGNVVRRHEKILSQDGSLDTLVSTHRYNEDGLLVKETLADGETTEYIFERDIFADMHGDNVEAATPAERLNFGNLRRVVRHPRPGSGESRRIVTDYEYADRGSVRGARLKSTRGPYYADQQNNELPNQAVGTTRFNYDTAGNLLTVQPPDVEQPDGTVITPAPTEYSYDSLGRLVGIRDGGVDHQLEYFADKRRSGFVRCVIEDPQGIARITESEVDDLGRITQTVTPYGATTDIEWTSFDAPRRIIHPAVVKGQPRPTISLEYDDNRQLVRSAEEVQDHTGLPHPDGPLVQTFAYNAYGRLVKHTRGPSSDSQAQVRTLVFNRSGLHERKTNWRGATTQIEYDERLNRKAVVRGWGTSAESRREMDYNRAGERIEVRDGRGAKTNYEYDAFGRLALTRDPDGNEHYLDAYNAAGQPLRQRLTGLPPQESNPIRWAESAREYDALGRIIRKHEHLFEPGSNAPDRILTTKFFYDKYGRLTKRIDPTGAEYTFAYDSLGRLTEARDPDGDTVTHNYDDAAREVTITTTHTGQDAKGNAVTHVSRTITKFDHRTFAVEATDIAGNTIHHGYDSRGNSIFTEDATGVQHHTRLNLFGHTVAESTGGVKTTYKRDPLGALTQVTDPVGNAIRFKRDALGRRTKTIRGNRQHQCTYDAEGYCIKVMDENDVVLEREFSPGGRLLVEKVKDGGFRPPPARSGYSPLSTGDVEYAYTPTGQVGFARNDVATVKRSYDSLGRLQRDDIDGRRVTLAYDDANRLSALTFPNGRQVKYTYSSGGVLESVQQIAQGQHYPGDSSLSATRTLLQTRHVGGRITHEDFGAVQVHIRHNTRRLPVSADWQSDGASILEERRLFGPRGECRVEQFGDMLRLADFDGLFRQTKVEDYSGIPTIDPSSLAPPATITNITMKGQQHENALVPSLSGPPERTISYDLDDNTNRDQVTETTGGGSPHRTNYVVGAFNQYEQVGPDRLVYDRIGNLIEAGSHSFVYDTQGRLAQTKTNGRVMTMLDYGPLGRLVTWDEEDVKRRFTYAGEHIVEWHSSDAAVPLAQLVYARSGICHLATNGVEFVPVTGLDGTVRGWINLANATARMAAQRTYGPFGRVTSQQGNWPAPVGYRGYLEGTSGLNLLRARAYSPNLGRFLQRDPAGLIDGPNLYAYANHAPMAMTDMWGFVSGSSDWKTTAGEGARVAEESEGGLWGGGTLAMGAVNLGLGVAILASGPVGWFGGLAAGMAISSGIAGVTVGGLQLATSHTRSARQNAQMNKAIQDTLSLTSSPGSLVGGTAAVLAGDEEDMGYWADVGGLVEGGGEILHGGMRLAYRELLFNRNYTGHVHKYGTKSMYKGLRKAYKRDVVENAATRYNPRLGKEEQLQLSHWVPQRFYDPDKLRNIAEETSSKSLEKAFDIGADVSGYVIMKKGRYDVELGNWLFNRPWNIKPMWKSEHALVDPKTKVTDNIFETLPPGIRHIRAMPKSLQEMSYGVGRTADSGQMMPEKERK